MLALDDPRWCTFRRKVGRPDEYLPLLRRLEGDPNTADAVVDEFWGGHWACSEFSPNEATLAVIPYFVAATERLPPSKRIGLLDFIGFCVALVAEDSELSKPADLRAEFDVAASKCLDLATETIACEMSADQLLSVLAAVASFKGFPAICNNLNGLMRSEGECPSCRCDLDLRKVCRWWT